MIDEKHSPALAATERALRGAAQLFHVDGDPIAQGSKRVFRGRTVDASNWGTKTRKAGALTRWRKAIASEFRKTGIRRMSKPEPVTVAIWFFFPRPKTVKREQPTVKPDADKLARAVLDALTGLAYDDDSQVVQLEIYKRYDLDGCAGCTIEVDRYEETGDMPF